MKITQLLLFSEDVGKVPVKSPDRVGKVPMKSSNRMIGDEYLYPTSPDPDIDEGPFADCDFGSYNDFGNSD